ncbi:MAG TPA: hypothetical protein VMU16_02295 [Candidatus Binataceae bacterium]|nr:hypothetical protein [Candidatus Binataceae bacterium]
MASHPSMERSAENYCLSQSRDRRGLLAFTIYTILSILIFGSSLWGRFGDAHIGTPATPGGLMLALVWWPYALVHRLNPFYAYFLWAPVGINLAWVTAMPLPSLLIWPATAAFGPIVSYNLLSLLSPALAGWGGFLLCRYISKSWWPSLLGGYIFGFSAYMMNEESSGDRHLTLVFLVPILGLIVSRAIFEVRSRSNIKLICLLAAILAAEFLISNEVFATMTWFGAIALATGWLVASPEIARRIVNVGCLTFCAYLLAAMIVSPNLYWLFAFGFPHGEILPGLAQNASADLLNLVAPPGSSVLGRIPPFRDLWAYASPPGINTNPSYIGLPSLAIAAVYLLRNWRSRLGKFLILSFTIVILFALGPRLHIHGTVLFPLPAGTLLSLPLIDKALPGRFTMYGSLFLGIIASLWFSTNRLRPMANTAVAAVIVLSTLPSPSFGWAYPINTPAFFATGMYRSYLKPGENVLVLPFGALSNCMLWLAQTGLYFRMVGGWTGLCPVEFSNWPALQAFSWPTFLPDATDQFGAFMAHFQVDATVVAGGGPDAESWDRIFSKFASAKYDAGGVTVYRILPSKLEPYRQATKIEMRQRAASGAIDALLLAGDQWLSAGHNLKQFEPAAGLRAGYLKDSWCVGPTRDLFSGQYPKSVDSMHYWFSVDSLHHWFCGIEVGGTTNGDLMIGLGGEYADFEPAIARYRTTAKHIFFPFPRDLLSPRTPVPPAKRLGYLEMEFEPDRISAIANQLRAPTP